MNDVNIEEIPDYLKDNHYANAKNLHHGNNYKYPHDYPNNYVDQEYMPEQLKNKKYYIYGQSYIEKEYQKYWDADKKMKDYALLWSKNNLYFINVRHLQIKLTSAYI